MPLTQLKVALPFALVALALEGAPAHADSYEGMPLGGRTAAMGKTGIARGNDSAMPFLNPAGLALLESSTASLSANVYAVTVVSVPHYSGATSELDPGNGGTFAYQLNQQGVQSIAVDTLPTSFAGMLHIQQGDTRHIFAATLAVPRVINRSFTENADLKGPGLAVRRSSTAKASLHQYDIGISYARNFGSKLRAGITTLGAFTLDERQDTGDKLFVQGAAVFQRSLSSTIVSAYSFDVGVTAGLQLDLAEDFSIGLAVRGPSIHAKGHADVTHSEGSYSNSSSPLLPTGLTSVRKTGDRVDGFPLRVGGGAFYRVTAKLSVAIDANLYLPRDGERQRNLVVSTAAIPPTLESQGDAQKVVERTPLRAVVNGSLGVEYALKGAWLRGGLFTDFADQTPVEEGDPSQRTLRFPWNHYGFTFGYATQIGPVESTFGLLASYGQGKTIRAPLLPVESPVTAAQPELTDGAALHTMVFLNGSIDSNAERQKAKAVLEESNKKQSEPLK